MPNRERTSPIGERLFSYLITTFYYRYRKLKGWEYGKLKHEPVIRFNGYFLEEFYFNEKTKQTEMRQGFHKREPLLILGDNFPVLTSSIYLNELFLYRQLGLRHYYQEKARFEKHFDFGALIQVLAHEIIHVILTDFYPQEEEHGDLHKKLVEEMVKMIEASPEHQELKKFWK
jgi:hypothetical protein